MDPTGIGYFFKKTVKFFFHFKAELLGMKTRRELKKKMLFQLCLIMVHYPKGRERLLNDCKTKQIDM